ncbi:hypothetical protein ABZ468_48870 [Streptomyces sp. NPDC005708]|uniref:hypothetical protein n=1 Tax=Streptomyces sp. NPDC005708 TaxID=3154564 RepID=UPI0033C773B3
MRTTTLLRTSAAVRTAPFLAAGCAYFFFVGIQPSLHFLGLDWPTRAVTFSLSSTLPPVYALTAAVACFEGHRLRKLRTWGIGPARSEPAIAARSLLAILGVFAVAVSAVPVVTLITTGSGIDGYALAALALPLVNIAGYALLGYSVGRRINALYAAPALAVSVQLLVGTSVSYLPYWPRHISGIVEPVGFGEAFEPVVFLTTTAATVAVGLAVALICLPTARRTVAVAAALSIAAVGFLVPYRITANWSFSAPTVAGLADTTCAGTAPKVCLPTVAGVDAAALQTRVSGVLTTLANAGAIPQVPTSVFEIKGAAKGERSSSAAFWRVNLIGAANGNEKDLAFALTMQSVNWFCSNPSWETMHYSTYWAMKKSGVDDRYLKWLRSEPEFKTAQEPQLTAEVGRVLKLPAAQQKSWYQDKIMQACAGSTMKFRPTAAG